MVGYSALNFLIQVRPHLLLKVNFVKGPPQFLIIHHHHHLFAFILQKSKKRK